MAGRTHNTSVACGHGLAATLWQSNQIKPDQMTCDLASRDSCEWMAMMAHALQERAANILHLGMFMDRYRVRPCISSQQDLMFFISSVSCIFARP